MFFGTINKLATPNSDSDYEKSLSLDFGKLWISPEHEISSSEYDLFWIGNITNLKKLMNAKNFSSPKELFDNLYTSDEYFRSMEGTFLIFKRCKKNNKLIIINNNHQSSKLFYYKNKSTIVFADRIEKIIPHLDTVEIFKPSVRSFIANGFTVSDQIQIKGLRKLLPSHCLELSSNSIEVKNFWPDEVHFDRQPFNNLEEKINEYESTYQSVLDNYFESRNPKNLGTLLSGGHDTSFALIQTAKVYDQNINAFTISFPDWSFDEESFAENIAKKFGAEFNSVHFTDKSIDDTVDMVRSIEEPAVGVALPLYTLSKFAKTKGIDVMLGGDGGDTLWGEYYPVGEIHKYIKNWSHSTRKFAHRFSKFMANTTDWERFWELEHVMELFSQENYYDQFMTKLCTYRHFRKDKQKKLFQADFFEDGSVSKSSYEVPFNKSNFDNALIEGKLFNAFYTYMGFTQTKLMSTLGIDFYMPTVQRPIRDFINNLPMNWVNGGTTFHRLTNSKSINRKFHKNALSRYLKKEEIYNRSFDIPWNRILMPRKSTLELLEKALIKRGWYNSEYINQIFSEFKSQKVKEYELLQLNNHGYRIFTLLSLEIWVQLYLDSKYKYGSPASLDEFLLG